MGKLKTPPGVLFLAAFFFASGIANAGEEPALPPYERRVRLDVWGGNLADAAQDLHRQTGVEIAIFLRDFPDDVLKQSLYMVSGDATLRQAMECLARRYRCRYRLVGNSRIEMSRGYGWTNAEFLVRFHDLTPLKGSGGDANELIRTLGEFLRVLPLLPGNASFVMEEPRTEDGESVRGVAVLPRPTADYFERATAALIGGATMPPTDQPPVRARLARTTVWKDVLAIELTLPPDGAGPRDVARAVSQATNGVVVWENPPPDGALNDDVIVRGATTVGIASRALGAWSGMGKRLLLNDGGIVLKAGREGEVEEDKGGREFFWGGLSVAGFDAARAASRAGGGAALLAQLRKGVFPEIWLDPACGLGYSPVTGRVVVVAPLNVVEAVQQEVRAVAEGRSVPGSP